METASTLLHQHLSRLLRAMGHWEEKGCAVKYIIPFLASLPTISGTETLFQALFRPGVVYLTAGQFLLWSLWKR